MQKLLFLIILTHYFFVSNGMELAATIESKFWNDWNVQGKIAKNIFLLTLCDDGCARNCPKRYPACYPSTPECKKFRLSCFDITGLEEYTLKNFPLVLVKKHINEFLDLIHLRQDWHEDPDFPLAEYDLRKILLKEFSLPKVYSTPLEARKIILDHPTFAHIALEGFSSEEYACFNGVQALKGTEIKIIPADSNLIWWYNYFQKPSCACMIGGFCGMFITGIGDQLWIPMSIGLVGGGFCVMDKLLLKLIRKFSSNPESWAPKKVTL